MLFQLGQLNATALAAPGVYLQIMPPKTRYINGVPTDIYAIVGVASWGPKNSPVVVGSPADAQRMFGNQQVRKYDLASASAIGFQVGAYNQRLVRVTDGTDVAATGNLMDVAGTPAIGVSLAAFYTGTVGNTITAAVTAGTKNATFKLTVALPGYTPEVFDNITPVVTSVTVTNGGTTYATAPTVTFSAPTLPGGVTATGTATVAAGVVTSVTITNPGSGYATAPTITFSGGGGTGATATSVFNPWALMASAVNNGQSGTRGPSQLVVATVGAGVALPNTAAPITLGAIPGTANVTSGTPGTDGTTTLTDAVLVGTDGATRTGMYSLRGAGASVLNMVDSSDATQWSAINTFALAEGMYAVTQGPAGASYSTVSTSLSTTAAVDSYALKVMVGDWVYWQDNVNGQSRMMAPATFEAAKIASQAPHYSTLNKPIAGITGTQRVNASQTYSNADIGAIVGARLDVISNPCPGGSYYGAQTGRNTSSNPSTNGDNYTRMTNYLALTLASSFGWVIGQLQTADLRLKAKGSMDAFLSNLEQQGMIGDVNGGPAFVVQINSANNPDSRVALGYLQADVQVKYLSVVYDFLINLEGGQSVSIQLKP